MRLTVLLLLVCSAHAHAATLDGRVVEDHTGNPLASVEVRVYRIGQRTLAAHLETDGNGNFRAANLPDGEYRIEATKANYIGAKVHLAALGPTIAIRLVRCGVISGRVLDGQGQVVLGASIYVLIKTGNSAHRPLTISEGGSFFSYARVDDQGNYRVHGLPPGEYALAASYGASTSMFGSTGGAEVRAGLGSGVQFYPTTQRPQYFPVSGGEQYRNIDFTIIPTTLHSVKGKVELPSPKTRFWLALVAADQPGVATAVAATKDDGAFAFEGVPAGVYTLTASGPQRGYGGKAILQPPPYFGRIPLSVGADVESVTVPVQRARPASFVLQPSGAGCGRTAQIALTATEDFAAMIDRSGDINAEKETPIPDLAPARYQVVARNLGESCYQPSVPVVDFSAPPAAVIPVPVAPAGAIHGKLAGMTSGARISVALISADPDNSAQPLQVVFADAAGRFSFGGLRPGPYRLAVQSGAERWVQDPKRMIELQVPAGAPTEIELPAPKRQP